MKVIRSKTFKKKVAWGAKEIACMNGVSTRLHWTNKPYKWHINDGEEVFVVLDGQVKMNYIEMQQKKSVILESGDIFFASIGTEHMADPIGEARILVIEKLGSL